MEEEVHPSIESSPRVPRSVLVVDDDRATCELVSTALGAWGYEVESANDGLTGSEKALAMKPDLVLLDIMMPGMDGFDTCLRIRDLIEAPVVFLSAKRDTASIAHGIEVGGVGYIRKPFGIAELRESVDRLLINRPLLNVDKEAGEPTGAAVPYTCKTSWTRDAYFAGKRIVDFCLAGVCLALLSPVLLIAAALIRLESPGSPMFKQIRIGSRRRKTPDGEIWETVPFTFYKLRTMVNDADSAPHKEYVQALIRKDQAGMAAAQNGETPTRKLVNDRRVTRLGRFLRRSSLDELPQLWNVLKGEMSLVGPRPPIPYEVEAYDPWHWKRLEAIPGMTGLWQVEARSSVGFDEMVRLDIWYAEHQSLWMDLKILLKTPLAVLSMRGAV
jgi:lipopolysaccharide/colanic/teichoic acid biosynthesis glycosyltransferase/ActR/RegA family two-component response regulator